MRGQALRQRLTQRVAINRLPGNHVADQLTRITLRCRAAKHHRVCDRLLNAGLRAEHMIDLIQFDTLTANLQLIVAATEIFHRAVIQPARHVAGEIHALAGHERIGDKAAGGEIGTAEIAMRQLHAG